MSYLNEFAFLADEWSVFISMTIALFIFAAVFFMVAKHAINERRDELEKEGDRKELSFVLKFPLFFALLVSTFVGTLEYFLILVILKNILLVLFCVTFLLIIVWVINSPLIKKLKQYQIEDTDPRIN
ncbi:MAG: NADH:ubiquinone oxidoreductase subunit 5 (subunit L)/multisubunit Na+/H+ antiporter MnhA subunit [Candidatus Paceibacteria bacterium]|jgi:NADH:ubiquinone oxidoreductase subunit 5 (subunit L)/multisubunit Na+/H+ antiporter MnhA subunit